MTPKTKATTTEAKMLVTMSRAFLELMRSAMSRLGSCATFSVAMVNVPPNSSNTSDTVVEVGMPIVLNTSRTMTSVTITARKIVITCWKE